MSIKFYRTEDQDERFASLRTIQMPKENIQPLVDKVTEFLGLPPVAIIIKEKLRANFYGMYYSGNTGYIKKWQFTARGWEYVHKDGTGSLSPNGPSARIEIDEGAGLRLSTIVHELGHHLDCFYGGPFNNKGKRRKSHTKKLLDYMDALKGILEREKYFGLLDENPVGETAPKEPMVANPDTRISKYELAILGEMSESKPILVKELVQIVGGNYQKVGLVLRSLEKRELVQRVYGSKEHPYLFNWYLTYQGRVKLQSEVE